MSEKREDGCDDALRSLTGSKRLDAIIVATVLSGLGATGVSFTKDDSDRFYGVDAQQLEARVVTRIDREEVESRLRDTELRDAISELRGSVSRQSAVTIRNQVQTEKNENLIDRLEREIKEHLRGH